MRKAILFVINAILAVLAFSLAYFAWQYGLLPLSFFSLLFAACCFGLSALFMLGNMIGTAYLTHPQNTHDFSHEVKKRKLLGWISFFCAWFCIFIAFLADGTKLFSLLTYVMSL